MIYSEEAARKLAAEWRVQESQPDEERKKMALLSIILLPVGIVIAAYVGALEWELHTDRYTRSRDS